MPPRIRRGGAPAIVECAQGRGRIVVVVNPADRDWSDWPTERIYLPVIRELFEYLTHSAAAPPPAETLAGVNEPRDLGIHPATAEQPLTVVATDPLEADVRADFTALRVVLSTEEPRGNAAPSPSVRRKPRRFTTA